MDPKMASKRLLGEILASSRLSWALLGLQQAFFESSGSTMIASSFSRCLLGWFLGSVKALLGPFLELFGSIQGLSWATWTSYGVCYGIFGSMLALGRPSRASPASSQRLRGILHDLGLGGANLRKTRYRTFIRLKVIRATRQKVNS